MSYAGDVSCAEALEAVNNGSVLVDVRTAGEWRHIGVPEVPEAPVAPLFIQWNVADGTNNPEFLSQLRQALISAKVSPDVELLFLCRSGARSVAAAEAATADGWKAFNILEGFEGVPDAHGDRVVNGWKNAKLPWKRVQQ
ncbi:MAG: rhodanese-like domain-containing protein [Acidobacteria bacterium]|nr:rhodanese-like domain-containing protein [Acidobacteriota bacterium]